MRLKISLKKILTVTATLATLFNSIGAPITVLAQEITPAPVDTSTPAPTDQATVTPSDAPTSTPDVTPAETVTPSPVDTATPTDVVTPPPSDQPQNSQAPESNPTVQGPPETPTISASATPTATPIAPIEQGTLNETLLTGIDLSGVTGLGTNVQGSGSISTNQSDYSPTSLVLISGSGFTANKTYTINIVSTDQPPVNFTDQVKADSSGNISYSYQLDGNYRPNYTVYIKDGGNIIASTSFTDTNPSANLEQCHNESGGLFADCKDPSSPTNTWGSGDAGSGNAKLFEGNSQNYRLILKNMTTGTPVTVSITQQFTKGGKMAYDYPTGPGNLGTATTPIGLVGIFPCDDNSGGLLVTPCPHTVPSTMAAGNLLPISPIPASTIPDATVDSETRASQTAYFGTSETTLPTRSPNSMYVYGATPGSFGGYTFTGTAAQVGSGDTSLNWSFTVTPTSSTVVIAWGAHISLSGDYGTKGTAVSITGSPYHTILDSVTGISGGGAQSMQMSAGAILLPPALNTQISASTITLGDSVTDTATYTETNKNAVSGTTQFYICGPTGSVTPCVTTTTPVGSAVTNSADSATSTTFTPASLGTYCFAAYYTPDSTAQYAATSSTLTTNECVTVNAPPTGTLNVHKATDTDADGSFETGDTGSNTLGFRWGFDSTTPSNNTNVFGTGITKNTGSYSIYENTVSNYHFVGWYNNGGQGSCTNPDGRTLPASATVSSSTTTNITLCNARNTGDLKAIKVVDDGTALTNWSFSLDGGNPVSADVTGTVDFGQVTTAVNHTITESGTHGSDYTLVSITGTNCTNNNDGSSGIAVVPNGGSTTCTFTNDIHRGTVNVTKYNDLNANGSQDNGEPGLLGWKINLTGQTQGTTDSNGQASFTNLLPGNFTLSEDLQSTWTQSNISCDNGTYSSQNKNFSLSVAAGQTVNCKIGNFQNAQITVQKDVVAPDGSAITDTSTNFTFSMTNETGFNLTDGGSKQFSVTPGTYTITETPNSNYTFTGCTNLDQSNSVTVTSGQSVTVLCTNKQKQATITVVKVVEKSDGSAVIDGHHFTVQLNGDSNSNQTIAMGGTDATYNVNPGDSNTIGELTDSNYTSLGCKLPTGADATDFSLASNGSVTVTCTNQQKPGTISGYKFESDNTTPISGWTVNLLNCVTAYATCSQIATTTTNASGFYSFTNLITGFYQVVEALVSTYTAVGDTSHNVTINPGTVSPNNNFSNFKNIDITVCKAQDADGSLSTTNDRTGVSGWDMTLNTDDSPTTSQSTNIDGCTVFSNLGPGHDYSVTEELQNGWTNLTQLTHDFGTPTDGVNQSYTFINFHNVSISGEKFNDINGNGSLDGGEPGLAGWTINLEDTSGNVLGTTTTDSNGNYSFTNLTPGTYRIREVGQAGWVQMTVNPNDITVASGQNVTGIDFGNQGQGIVKVTKFLDDNANGTMDASESGLINWSISLDKTSQTTGSDGTTTFQNVPAGSHTISETIQNGWLQSNIYCDSDESFSVNPNNNHQIDVGPGDTINCFVGNYQNGKITVAKVITDPNGDPITDTTEFYFEVLGKNVTYTNNDLIAGGSSLDFGPLKPGTYDVNEATNPRYDFKGCTAQYEGNEIGIPLTLGEEVTVTSGDTVIVTCTNQQTPGTVTGLKWNDLNANGQNDEEPTLADWTIFADLNHNGILDDGEPSTTTDQNGDYTLSLNPGTYSICEVLQTGWVQTHPGGETQCYENIKVGSGEQYDGNLDFGNFLIPLPHLDLTKSNDKGGGASAGDTVTYTLSVTNSGNVNVNNVVLTDVLPAGFSYVANSTTNDGEPNVSGSTLTWPGVTILAGQTFTITYQAKIDGSESNGTYTNFASCEGTTGNLSLDTIALFQNLGRPVTCEPDPVTSTVTLGSTPGFGGKLGQVLGLSTELPATGSPTELFIFALGALGLGLFLNGYNKRRKEETPR